MTNEEDHSDILSIDIATHRVTRLYGRPGVHRRRGRRSSTGPTTPTSFPTARSPSPTPTTAASSSSAHRRIVRQIGRTGVCVPRPAADARLGQRRHAAPGRRRARLARSTAPGSTTSGQHGKVALVVPGARVAIPPTRSRCRGGRVLLADYANPGAVVILNRRGTSSGGTAPPPAGEPSTTRPSRSCSRTATSPSTTTTTTGS